MADTSKDLNAELKKMEARFLEGHGWSVRQEGSERAPRWLWTHPNFVGEFNCMEAVHRQRKRMMPKRSAEVVSRLLSTLHERRVMIDEDIKDIQGSCTHKFDERRKQSPISDDGICDACQQDTRKE